MTKPQIKKAFKANLIPLSNIEILSGNDIEVFIEDPDQPGSADQKQTDELSDKVSSALGWGGFQTGCGSWVLREGYAIDNTDYCNTASSIHY